MLTRVECVFGDTSPKAVSRCQASLREAFPTLTVAVASAPASDAWCVDLAAWCSGSISLWEFDQLADDALEGRATKVALLAPTPGSADASLGVLTRCQRWIGRRNGHTQGAAFDDLLKAHCLLYDVRKPLLLADYRHALDTWQWILRLAPDAGAPLQVAALLHDIERIASERDQRIEHLAPNYERFKAAHARRGAEMARSFLRNVPMSPVQAKRVADLVARHETPAGDEDLAVLNDADALSFFSLNSAGFFDYYEPAHTARKIRYTLARMRPRARHELANVWLRPDVAHLTRQALAAENPHPIASAP